MPTKIRLSLNQLDGMKWLSVAMSVAAAALLILLASLTRAQAEADEIGSVEEIRLALYGTVAGGESERLYENDGVYADELIKTVKRSSARIRFLDDTDLWLGASSEMILEPV